MKAIKRLFVFIFIMALLTPTLLVQAANYVIVINNREVTTTQDMIFNVSGVGTGDVITYDIRVSNRDSHVYVIRLTSVEVVQSSILLDRLTFRFQGINDDGQFTFTSEDFETLNRPVLYRVNGNSEGSFQITTEVGTLNNAYQGTSVTLRFHFEATRLYEGADDPEAPPTQPGATPTPPGTNDPTTTPPSGNAPITGDESNIILWVGIFAISVAALFSLLIFFLLIGKRKKNKVEEPEEQEKGNIQ